MGLGKTIQAISLIVQITAQHEYFPHLFVVPNSTLMNWKREFEHWAPHVRLYVLLFNPNLNNLNYLYFYFHHNNTHSSLHSS